MLTDDIHGGRNHGRVEGRCIGGYLAAVQACSIQLEIGQRYLGRVALRFLRNKGKQNFDGALEKYKGNSDDARASRPLLITTSPPPSLPPLSLISLKAGNSKRKSTFISADDTFISVNYTL